MGEKYCKNSIIASRIALAAFLLCCVADLWFLVRWSSYGQLGNALAVFVPLVLVHLVFLVLSVIWYKNRNKMKNTDGKSKMRSAPRGSLAGLFIMALVAVYAFATANAMVEYVYNSKNGRGDMDLADFKAGASMTVISGDHTYAIYVYAMADNPGVKVDGEYLEFDEPWLGGDSLWSGILNIKDGSQSPILYGNVISYGYVEGTYSR